MKKNENYYYYEFQDFDFNKDSILNLITTNYKRRKEINKEYKILIIGNNRKYEKIVRAVNEEINKLTLETLKKYLKSTIDKGYEITEKDLLELKKIKLIKMEKDEYENYNNNYDFVILKKLTVKQLKKIIKDKCYHEKNDFPINEQNFFYFLYFKNSYYRIFKKLAKKSK